VLLLPGIYSGSFKSASKRLKTGDCGGDHIAGLVPTFVVVSAVSKIQYLFVGFVQAVLLCSELGETK
jgi:hypothetical protein